MCLSDRQAGKTAKRTARFGIVECVLKLCIVFRVRKPERACNLTTAYEKMTRSIRKKVISVQKVKQFYLRINWS